MQNRIFSKLAISYFCANTKPNELDSSFSAAKHEIIETKASDTFGLGDAETSTTLRSVAKFLKHATSQHIGNDADVDTSAKTKESNDYSVKRTDPFGYHHKVGGAVKSMRDCDNFVYY